MEYHPMPEFLGNVQCEHCLQVAVHPHFVERHFGRVTIRIPFCNEEHANQYYLKKLREQGL